MTVKGIAEILNVTPQNVMQVMKNNYGFYICEWLPSRGMPISVWQCVQVPENEPKPKPKNKFSL